MIAKLRGEWIHSELIMAEYAFASNNVTRKRREFQSEVIKGKQRVAENEPSLINRVSLQLKEAKYKRWPKLKHRIIIKDSPPIYNVGRRKPNHVFNKAQKLVL